MKYVELDSNNKVVTVRSMPYPPENPYTIEVPDEVECGWEKQGDSWVESAELIAARLRKKWKNVSEFVAEFTMEELGVIQLSQNPTIAALRYILSVWNGEIWNDDPRIVGGLSLMVAENIISAERKNEILN